MTQAHIEQQKAWQGLCGTDSKYVPYTTAPPGTRLASEPAPAQGLAAQNAPLPYQSFQQQYHQQAIQRRPIPHRQYPKTELCRPVHSNRASAPPPPRTAHNLNSVPSSLAVGQPRQQLQASSSLQPEPQPSRYRHSALPPALAPYYQLEQSRQRHSLQPQQQHDRHVLESGPVAWAGVPYSSLSSTTSTSAAAASRLSMMSNLTTASTASSGASSPDCLPIPYHGFDIDESPLARLQSHLPKAADTGSFEIPSGSDDGHDTVRINAGRVASGSAAIESAMHNLDPSQCPQPLRVPRRPVSMGATKSYRRELRISTQNLEPTAIRVEDVQAELKRIRSVRRGNSIDPLSASSYRSDDYEDYMSPIVAAELRERASANGGNSRGNSELDRELDGMLSAELELKAVLMRMGSSDAPDELCAELESGLESGPKPKLPADGAIGSEPAAEWQRWREYLNEGVDDDE